MTRALRAGIVLSALVAAGLAVPASAATPVYEIEYVQSVDGALVRVETIRDPDVEDAPVILTYSPYNTLGDTRRLAEDSVWRRYKGQYARAFADVLGTRGSDGCWDYGGAKEQRSGADVVMHLARKPWSNGRVGMTGVSYEGTTATMVAALGDSISADSRPDGKGLAGIVPVAAISRWYGYAYGDGVRYLGNSRVPTDEGFDTPLAFDLGFGRTVPVDPQRDPGAFTRAARARTGECGTVEHTERGYDRSPDYDAFWQERDYRKDAAAFRVPTMVVHGWQDYNVKQEEATALYEQIPVDDPRTARREGVPFKKLWMTQAAHANGSGAGYLDLLDAFWAKTLRGQDSPLLDGPDVTTFGRTAAGAAPTATALDDYRGDGVAGDLTLHLGRSSDTAAGVPSTGPVGTGERGVLSLAPLGTGSSSGWTHLDPGTVSEEASLADPRHRGRSVGGQQAGSHGPAWLYHESAELTEPVRILGSATLKTTVSSTSPGQHLTPLLVEVLPSGALNLVQRGFLNLDYRKGLEQARPTTGPQRATVTFLPQDYTFAEGSRIGLVLQGSNTVWAVPGSGGSLSYDLRRGASKLVLPLAEPVTSPLPR